MTDNHLPNQEQLKEIIKPHAHDVLSGRGNFVNHHSGNENFRKLVKHHKKAYVACPKSQKAIYSKIIYDEIRAMNPAGRFLKQDPKTKLWSDIGEKKALDKTRQALREGAPELLKELETGVPGGDGTGGNINGEDFVAPLRMSRNGHPLAESLLGNISLGSFSLGSFNNGAGASFTTAGAGNGNGASFSGVPSQVGMGDNTLMYNAQGTNSILAAAAQLQAQQQAIQQQQQQSQNSNNPAQWEAQLEILKAQMQMNSQQANNMAAAAQVQQQQQQQGGAGGTGGDNNNNMANNQNSGFNAMLVAAQQASMGSNEVTALLAAIHNGATGNNVSSGGMGMGNNNLYQQQLAQAQAAMFMSNNNMSNSSSMNGSQGTLVTGNLNNMNNNIGQMNNNSNSTNTNSANNRGGNSSGNGSTFGSAVGNNNNQQHQVSFASIASQNQQQQRQNQQGQNTNELRQNDRSQEQQQHFQGGYGEQSFNVCVPLKPSSDDNLLDNPTPLETPGQHNRRNMRGGGNLNSSFTRAQRIGLKNSFTRRPNRHMRNPDIQSSLKNSLMSIESLTLDDIDSSEFSGGNMEGVFDESETESKGSNLENGHGKHGHGPHDMSDMSKMSEVSEL